MNTFLFELFNYLDNLVTVLVVLGSFFGFIFRHWITERIKAKMTRAVSSELETIKHQYTKEIENHKSVLLRELEEYKLGIDLKRNLQLQLANAKLTACQSLVPALNTASASVVAFPIYGPSVRPTAAKQVAEQLERANKEWSENQVFLDQELNVEITSLLSDLHGFYGEFLNSEKQLSADDPRICDIHKRIGNISLRLKKSLIPIQ